MNIRENAGKTEPLESNYLAWIVDDDIANFEERLRNALRTERIDLETFREPQKCLDAVGSASKRPDLVISDLQFDSAPLPPRNLVGAYLPWRVNGRVKEAGWTTQTTLLTNFLDRYLGDLCRVYKTKGFAPKLICSKSFAAEAEGLTTFAKALRLLCEARSLTGIATTMSEIPCYILEPPSGGGTRVSRTFGWAKLPTAYLITFFCSIVAEAASVRPGIALAGFLGGMLTYTRVWNSIWGILAGGVLGAFLWAAVTVIRGRGVGSLEIERVL